MIKNLLVILVFVTNLFSQRFPQKYWVYFDDCSRPDDELRYINEKALNRLDELDVEIHVKSKFLNAVSVIIYDESTYHLLLNSEHIHKLSTVQQSAPREDKERLYKDPPFPFYGESKEQLDMLHIRDAHKNGLTGDGICIAVFDAGFNTEHEAFSQLNLLATYDFVDNEINVHKGGSSHGTATLSLLGAYDNGVFIGSAYDAVYLLARTEDIYSETRAEEDNWVAALEWADSLGVDIVSSSLNYLDFSGSNEDYSFEDLDGETTAITQATNIASSLGILVVNSIGNEGFSDNPSTLWAPADGKHVLSVGAIDFNKNSPPWSSRGPTYDNRIKPNVVGPGVAITIARETGRYTIGNGTSYATPLVAGATALVLQANPNLSPDELIEEMQNNSSNAISPNNIIGWGIPNIESLVKTPATQFVLEVFPNPTQHLSFFIKTQRSWASKILGVSLYDITGQKINAKMFIESPRLIHVKILDDPSSGLYFIRAQTSFGDILGKIVYINTNVTSILPYK